MSGRQFDLIIFSFLSKTENTIICKILSMLYFPQYPSTQTKFSLLIFLYV